MIHPSTLTPSLGPNYYLLQELAAGGDLYQKANNGTRFNEQRTASTVIKPFMNALKYLHSQVGAGFHAPSLPLGMLVPVPPDAGTDSDNDIEIFVAAS